MKFVSVKKTVEKAQEEGRESVVLIFKKNSECAKNGAGTVKVKISDVKHIVTERVGKVRFDSQEFYLRDIEKVR